ncbi:DNA polymerase delta subunit 4 [Linum perenne]
MKSYYKQKKTNRVSDVGKTSSSSKSIKKKSSPASAVSLVSGVYRIRRILILFLLLCSENVEKGEQMLREFDMNMAYGPCIGMTRSARWERAHRLGMNPSGEIKDLLDGGNVKAQSVWDGRV